MIQGQAIYLDGYPYYVEKKDYVESPTTFATYSRGNTGLPAVVESGVFVRDYKLSLNCSQYDLTRLEEAFVKCHNTPVYLDFIDERNFQWLVAAGTNDANHAYSTGVWLEPGYSVQPATEALYDDVSGTCFSPFRRFVVKLHLIPNARQLNAA